MKIHEDVLPSNLLKKCLEEISLMRDTQVWGISTCIWSEELREGTVGNVSMRFLSAETSIEINNVLAEKYFPRTGRRYDIIYQYYLWDKMSGISHHDDWKYDFGATLYLNEAWNPKRGGLYVWKDKDEKNEYKLNALCPKQNMLVINDERVVHSVTSIATTIPYPRTTIQIWGTCTT